MRLLVSLASVVLLCGPVTIRAEGDFQITSHNFDAWRAHIRATADERAPLDSLPWQPSFADGLREGAAQQKPVLLWTMNGHPLGCT